MSRTVDNSEYIKILLEIMKSDKTVSLTVAGDSMEPFLKDSRDRVFLRAIDNTDNIRKGDIVLFERSTGQYVLHRVYKKERDIFYFIGDGQGTAEGPLYPEQLKAFVQGAEINGRVCFPGSLRWEFFRRIWINLRVRALIRRLRMFM